MVPEIIRSLRCPVCRAAMSQVPAGAGQALRCSRGHNFDIARQGYVNLLTGHAVHSGDSPAMVAAREEFLNAGHYNIISAVLGETAQAQTVPAQTYQPLVVDAGAGTGRHLAAVLDALPPAVGLALDVSKAASRRAARAHPRAGAALVDTWGPLPLADASVAVLLNVFAPRNGSEFRRVLRADGILLVVTPHEDHLQELVETLGLLRVDPEKTNRVAESLGNGFTPGPVTAHRTQLALTHTQVTTLVAMGPSAWHTDPDRLAQQVAALPEPVAVTLAIRLSIHFPT